MLVEEPVRICPLYAPLQLAGGFNSTVPVWTGSSLVELLAVADMLQGFVQWLQLADGNDVRSY